MTESFSLLNNVKHRVFFDFFLEGLSVSKVPVQCTLAGQHFFEFLRNYFIYAVTVFQFFQLFTYAVTVFYIFFELFSPCGYSFFFRN